MHFENIRKLRDLAVKHAALAPNELQDELAACIPNYKQSDFGKIKWILSQISDIHSNLEYTPKKVYASSSAGSSSDSGRQSYFISLSKRALADSLDADAKLALKEAATRLEVEIDLNELDTKVYNKLLTYMLAASIFEGFSQDFARVMAYKCAILFGGSKDAVKYLMNYIENHGSGSNQPIHDACLFNVPVRQAWDTGLWRSMLPRLMTNKELIHLGILNNLGKIQDAAVQSGRYFITPDPLDPNILKRNELIGEHKYASDNLNAIHSEIINVRRSIASLNDEDEIDKAKQTLNELETTRKQLKLTAADLNNQIRKLKSPKPLSEATVSDLAAIASTIWYDNAVKDPHAAKLFNKFGLNNADYQLWLELKSTAKDSDKAIPKMIINGADYGCPNLFLVKLDKDDPKAAVLGHITGCCQSLGGLGTVCTQHGISSEYGGFYALCRGTPIKEGESTKLIKPKDIIAQTWAWRGQDGALVFDSIESQPNLRIIPKYNESIIKLFSVLAKQCASEKEVPQVNVGIFGQTPKELGYKCLGRFFPDDDTGVYPQFWHSDASMGMARFQHLYSKAYSSEPIDHPGYRDSDYQREMFNSSSPWTGMICYDPKAAIELMKENNINDIGAIRMVINQIVKLDKPECIQLYMDIMEQDDLTALIKQTNLIRNSAHHSSFKLLFFLHERGVDISESLLAILSNLHNKTFDEIDRHKALLKQLLPLGINVNIQDEEGKTPLMIAREQRLGYLILPILQEFEAESRIETIRPRP